MTSDFASFQSGRYQVLRRLGKGGKGIVFLCQDTALSRNVAVKVIKEEMLDPEELLRFQREVQAMGKLLHPHVVTVFDGRGTRNLPENPVQKDGGKGFGP